MNEELVIIDKQEDFYVLSINNPAQDNALTPEVLDKLSDALLQIKEEGKARVVIISGTGEQSFSSGYDIKGLPIGTSDEKIKIQQHYLDRCFDIIVNSPFPIIAMLYGYVVGAGLELAVTCDFRIAADNAKLGITPARLGVTYSISGILKFMKLVGTSATKELFFTARLIDAHRARDIKLVDYVFPAQNLLAETQKFAREVASNAPLSIAYMKSIITRLSVASSLSSNDRY